MKSLVRTGYPYGVIVYCYGRDSSHSGGLAYIDFFLDFDYSFWRGMGRVEYVGR